jgi:hypothetical protein
MTSSLPEPVDDTVAGWIERLTQEGKLDIQPDTRCRVCRDPSIRSTVNKLIARGDTLTDIIDTLEPVNRVLDPNDRINYDILYRHRRKHFDVQSPAYAIHRRILEQRAQEIGNDMEQGIGVQLDYIAFLQSMMVRGYENLTDPDTVIPAKDGLAAAKELDDIRRKAEGQIDKARVMAEMNRVIAAVKRMLPREQWPALQAALAGDEEVESPKPIASERQDDDQEVEIVPIMGDDEGFD